MNIYGNLQKTIEIKKRELRCSPRLIIFSSGLFSQLDICNQFDVFTQSQATGLGKSIIG